MLCTCIAIFVCLCAFLGVSEAAVSSVSMARARAYAEPRPSLASMVEWELEQRQEVIITILVAHNLFSVAASSFATLLALGFLGESGPVWATVIMTLIMVVFAEFFPKCVGMVCAEKTFSFVLPGLRFLSFLACPFVVLLDRIVSVFSRLFRIDMTLESSIVTRDEIEQLVKSGEESGAIEESERRMIDGVIAFDETRVSEIMVPRVSMDALEVNQTIGDVIAEIQDWEHSRIPVYSETPDDIVGVLYLKDMIPYLRANAHSTPLSSFMRKPLFVPETMIVHDLFDIMKSDRIHFAVVVDEYGGTAGILTLEDLLEQIVGEIQDEYDEEAEPIVQVKPGTYRVQCSVSLEELSEAADYDFCCDEVDSVGGYVLDRFGNFPAQGDTIEDGPWIIEVTSVGEHRVNEVLFTRKELQSGSKSLQEE